MIILRNKYLKYFSEQQGQENNQPSSQELQIEQMRLQRQLLLTQRQKELMKGKEVRDRMRNLQAAQRLEARRDEQDDKNILKVQKMIEDSNQVKNVSLYKTRSKTTEPVAMK